MDGLELHIRQSPTWPLYKFDGNFLDFLAASLLSEPLDESHQAPLNIPIRGSQPQVPHTPIGKPRGFGGSPSQVSIPPGFERFSQPQFAPPSSPPRRSQNNENPNRENVSPRRYLVKELNEDED